MPKQFEEHPILKLDDTEKVRIHQNPAHEKTQISEQHESINHADSLYTEAFDIAAPYIDGPENLKDLLGTTYKEGLENAYHSLFSIQREMGDLLEEVAPDSLEAIQIRGLQVEISRRFVEVGQMLHQEEVTSQIEKQGIEATVQEMAPKESNSEFKLAITDQLREALWANRKNAEYKIDVQEKELEDTQKALVELSQFRRKANLLISDIGFDAHAANLGKNSFFGRIGDSLYKLQSRRLMKKSIGEGLTDDQLKIIEQLTKPLEGEGKTTLPQLAEGSEFPLLSTSMYEQIASGNIENLSSLQKQLTRTIKGLDERMNYMKSAEMAAKIRLADLKSQ